MMSEFLSKISQVVSVDKPAITDENPLEKVRKVLDFDSASGPGHGRSIVPGQTDLPADPPEEDVPIHQESLTDKEEVNKESQRQSPTKSVATVEETPPPSDEAPALKKKKKKKHKHHKRKRHHSSESRKRRHSSDSNESVHSQKKAKYADSVMSDHSANRQSRRSRTRSRSVDSAGSEAGIRRPDYQTTIRRVRSLLHDRLPEGSKTPVKKDSAIGGCVDKRPEKCRTTHGHGRCLLLSQICSRLWLSTKSRRSC